MILCDIFIQHLEKCPTRRENGLFCKYISKSNVPCIPALAWGLTGVGGTLLPFERGRGRAGTVAHFVIFKELYRVVYDPTGWIRGQK